MLRIRSLQTVSLSLFAALALATSAVAWPGGGPGGHGGKGFLLQRQLEKLELPAETRSQVDAVLAESRTRQEALHQQIRAAHESMRSLLDQGSVDEAAVMAQADTIGSLMTEARKDDLKTLIQVRSLLTPEQRAALDQQMEKRREDWRGKRHGKGGDCEHGDAKPDQAGTPPTADVES
ncbi:MAG TPA: Spy/CpxP family protein refolding chaperone [Myxococcota bacterium]|jgi:Spy/CpxP family protein refolding chaperone|nr:Spy/CpxP family protein refolding chaperone [Myxococcota bacterium]